MSTQINSSGIYNAFSNSITVKGLTGTKSNDIPDEKTTINLTSVGTEDLQAIDTFLKSSNPEKWKVKIDDKYIDLSKDSKEWLNLLKSKITKGSVTKAEFKIIDNKPAIEVFLRNASENVGIHDKDGSSLNPFQDYEDPLVLGKKIYTFDTPEKAEDFCKKRSGAEIIVRNKEGKYDIFEIKGDAKKVISSSDFQENYSSFTKNISNMMGGTHSFISTSDNKLMSLVGHTAVEIPNINYNLARVDLDLKLEDINGIETDGLRDLNGTIKGSISIDIQHKLEEVLNGLGLPQNTRVNIEYDSKEKVFRAEINYQKGVLDATPTVLTLKPLENGSLSIDALGLLGVNLNLNNGIALGVDALGKVNYQLVDVNTTKNNSPNVNILGKNFTASKTENGAYSFSPTATNYDLFVDIPSNFEFNLPLAGKQDISIDKLDDMEKYIHKTIADTVVNLAKSFNNVGFKIPEKLLKIDSNKLTQEDKQLINDFVNGKVPLQIDLEKYIQVKGFERISINELEPNIKFVNTADNQLGVTFDTKVIASTNGNAKELATVDKGGSDKISVSIDASINNVSSSLSTKLDAEAHVDSNKKADFEKKFGIKASGDFNLKAEVAVNAETNNLNNLDISADVSISAKNASIEIPNTNVVANLNVKPSKIGSDVKLSQEDNKISLNADVETVLSGTLKSKDNKQTLAEINYLSVKGNLVCESEKGLAKLTSSGAIAVTGKFDNFSVTNLSSYGSFRYLEKDGISISSSASISLKGSANKPAIIKSNDGKERFQINNINGSGSINFNKDGSIHNSHVKGNVDIQGSITGNPYALKATGNVKINRLADGTMQFDLKTASVDKLQFNDVTLEGIKNLSGKITYNPKTKEIFIESLTDEPQNITGKINGKDLSIKGASSKIKIDGTFTNKDNASLSIIPEGNVQSIKYDNYELKDFSMKGGRLLVGASKSNGNSIQSLILENLMPNVPLEVKGKLIDDKKNAIDLNIVANGSVTIDSQKYLNQTRKYCISSDVNINKLTFGNLKFENVKIEGMLASQDGKIFVDGNDNSKKLVFDANLIQGNRKEKIHFDTNGTLQIEKTSTGLELACNQKLNVVYEDVELKDAVINGKIKYTDVNGNKTVNFSSLNGQNNLTMTGALSFSSIEKNKRMLINFDNLQLDGSATIERDGNIKFNDLKTKMAGNVNGIALDLVTECNTFEKGNYNIKISGEIQNAIEIGSGFTVQRLNQDEIKIIGDMNTKTNGDVAFKKMTSYLNKLPLGSEYHRELKELDKMTYNLKDADMALDMDNLSIKFNKKTKAVELETDIKGGIKGLTAVYNTAGDYSINSGLAKNILEKYKNISENTKEMLNNIILSKKSTTLPKEKFESMLTSLKIPSYDIEMLKKEFKVPEYNADGGVSGHLTINSLTGKTTISNGELYAGLDKLNKIFGNLMKEDYSRTGAITEFRDKNDKQILDIYLNKDMKKKFPIELDPNKTGISKDGSLDFKLSTSVFFDIFGITLHGKTKLGVENGSLKLSLDKLNVLGFIGVKGYGTEKLDEQLEQMFDGSEKSQKALYELTKTKASSNFKDSWIKSGKQAIGKEFDKGLEKELEKLNLNSLEKYTEHYGFIKVDLKNHAIYLDLAGLISDPNPVDGRGNKKSSTVIKFEDTENIFLDGKKSELVQKDETLAQNQEKFSIKFNMEVVEPNTQAIVSDVVDFIDAIDVKTGVSGLVDVLDAENTVINSAGKAYDKIIDKQVNPTLEQIDKTKTTIEGVEKTIKTKVNTTGGQVNNVVKDANTKVNQAENSRKGLGI